MEPNPYKMMALNNAWANATLYAAFAGLAPGAFTAPRPGFFPSLAQTMNHIHAVDLYYIDALEQGGEGRRVYERDEETAPERLAAAQAAADMRLTRFCAGLTPEILQQVRSTDRVPQPINEQVEALLLHLFQHQLHHRGQAHVQLQDAGVAPPQLDEFYLIYDRAPSAEAYFR